jgi:hypothetical protein
MVNRPKIYKKLLTVIKDDMGVIRVVESCDEHITYYTQNVDKLTFSKVTKHLTSGLIEKIEKSKKIGDLISITPLGVDRYEITWNT